MSMNDVLRTTLAAFQDPAIGLETQVQTLIGQGQPSVRTDFAFGKWTVRQALRDTRTPSVTISPQTGADEVAVEQTGHADNVQDIQIALEYFDAEPDARQDAIAVIQAAVLMVLTHLVTYSQANVVPGTSAIYDVVSPAVTTYGEFESPATVIGAGFITRVTLRERSKQ
jgi:hypothetical protein